MQTVQRFEKNKLGRDMVCGDIHGCFTKLETELYTIGFDEKVDRLFCVGDLCDRGPESHLFMEWLDKPWFHSVKGNHEELLEGTLRRDAGYYQCHMGNGGTWVLDFLDTDWECEAAVYLMELPYIIEVETDNGLVGIIHADTGLCYDWEKFKRGVEVDKPMYRDNCTWGRDHIKYKRTNIVGGITSIYVGHSPVDSVEQYGNIVYIDTGACFAGGGFTILSL